VDKTVLTLAVDSTQVGTAAAAFDRMVNAGNAAAASGAKLTSTALAQGRAIGQTLVPALSRGAAGARTLAEAQKALGEDATRQIAQRPVAPRIVTPVAPVPQSAATGRAVPAAIPTAAGFGQLPGAAASAQSAIDRLTAAARSNRAALVQLAPTADATVRSFRQLNATPIKLAAPQGLSTVAAVLASSARVNPNPLRQVAQAWEDTANQAARAAATISQANRAISATPRGSLTMAGSAPRAPLSAQEVISSATGQRISTAAGFSTSEMTVEANRAQGAIERLTNAARDQRSALNQAAASASSTADAYRELAGVPTPVGGSFGPNGIPARPIPGTPAGGRPAAGNPLGGGRPAPNGGDAGPDFGSTSQQLQQLSYQLNDFFVQIASGGSALTAFIQQGSQLAGTYGGVRPAFQAVLNLLTPMRVAVGGAATAVAGLTYAFVQGQRESRAFADAITMSGNYAGQTEGRFNALASAVASSSQATVGAAREAAQAVIGTGQIGPQVFDVATEAVARYAQATGKTADEVAKYFAAMGQSPAKWAEEHNKATNFITAAQYEQVKALEESGRAADAQGIIYNALNERLRKLEPNLSTLDRALNNTKKAWSAFWNAAFDIGRTDTIEDKIGYLQNAITSARAGGNPFGQTAKSSMTRVSASAIPVYESSLQDQLAGQARVQADAQNAADKAEANRAAIAADAVVGSYLKRAKAASQYKDKLDELERSFKAKAMAGVPVSDADQKIARTQLAKDFAPAKGPKNNDANQILAAQLQTDLRRISDAFEQQRDAFQFQNEFVEAAYRNGNISISTLLEQRRQVIEDSARAEIASLDKEEARLKQYLATVKDGSERTQVQGQIEEVGVARQRVELRAQRDVVLLNEEGAASYRALSDQVVNYRANLLQMQGDEAGAAALRAQTVITNAKLLAAQAAGMPDAKVDVSALERAIAITDQFNEVQRQASLLAGNSARAEESFLLAAEQSGRSLIETERGLFQLRSQELDQLGALARKAKELADASTDPRIKAFAADLALEYAKAANAIDPALNRLRDAQRELAGGLSQIAGNGPNAFAQVYNQRRAESERDIKASKEEYDRRIDQLRGYLAQEKDERNKASLKRRIDQLQGESDGLKVESKGKAALNAVNEAVLKPMAEQVSNTVTKLLIQDPLQKYLEGQLKSLTEGDGFLAGFFKDALGIEADPKQQALLQQTAAITASTSALDVLTAAAQNAANALARAPGAALPGDFRLPGDAPAVDGELAGVGDASESVSQFGAETLKTTSTLAQLANSADLGGGAMARLPGIIGLFQSAVAMLTSSSASNSGSGIFGTIAGLFGGGGGSYEAAVASTGIFHVGGIVAEPKQTRDVPMGLFAGAPRYHTGGIVGKKADGARSALAAAAELKAGEVPAILMKNEEVLRADDPRHRANLGAEVFAKVMQTKGENSATVLQGLLGRLGVKDGGESAASGALKVRGARELGGPVSAGGLYRVNERGPELLQVAGKEYLMMGSQGGKVESAGAGKGEGKSLSIQVQVTAQPGMSRATAQQQGAQIARGIALAQRRNG